VARLIERLRIVTWVAKILQRTTWSQILRLHAALVYQKLSPSDFLTNKYPDIIAGLFKHVSYSIYTATFGPASLVFPSPP
jgi:hypothetical protein